MHFFNGVRISRGIATCALGLTLASSGLTWAEQNDCDPESGRNPQLTQLCKCKAGQDGKLTFDLAGSDAAFKAAFAKPETLVSAVSQLVPIDLETFTESYLEPATKVHGCFFKTGANPVSFLGGFMGGGANECSLINQSKLSNSFGMPSGSNFPIPFPSEESSNQKLARCDLYAANLIAGLERGQRIVKENGVDPDKIVYVGQNGTQIYDLLARDNDGLIVGPTGIKNSFANRLKLANGQTPEGDTESKKIRAVVAEMFWRQVVVFVAGTNADAEKDPLKIITGVGSNIGATVPGLYQGAINNFSGAKPRSFVFNKDWDCTPDGSGKPKGRGVINQANDGAQYAWLKRGDSPTKERYLDGGKASTFFCAEYSIPGISGRVMKNFKQLPGQRGRIIQSVWKVAKTIHSQILEQGHVPDLESILQQDSRSLVTGMDAKLLREKIEMHRRETNLPGYDRTLKTYRNQPLTFKRLGLTRGLASTQDGMKAEECSTSGTGGEGAGSVSALLNKSENKMDGTLSTRCYYESAAMMLEVHAVSDYAVAVFRIIAESLVNDMIAQSTEKSYVMLEGRLDGSGDEPVKASPSLLIALLSMFGFAGGFGRRFTRGAANPSTGPSASRMLLIAALLGVSAAACSPPSPERMSCGNKAPGTCEDNCKDRKTNMVDPAIADMKDLISKLDPSKEEDARTIATYNSKIRMLEEDFEKALPACKMRSFTGYDIGEADATLAQEACHCNSSSGSSSGGGDGGLSLTFDNNIGLGDNLVSQTGVLPAGGDLEDPDANVSAAIEAPELNLPIEGASGLASSTAGGTDPKLLGRAVSGLGGRGSTRSQGPIPLKPANGGASGTGSVSTSAAESGENLAVTLYNQAANIGGKLSGALYKGGGLAGKKGASGADDSDSAGGPGGVSEQNFGANGDKASGSGQDGAAGGSGDGSDAAKRGLASQGAEGELRKPFHNIFEVVTRHYMTTAGKWEIDKMRSPSSAIPTKK